VHSLSCSLGQGNIAGSRSKRLNSRRSPIAQALTWKIKRVSGVFKRHIAFSCGEGAKEQNWRAGAAEARK